MMETARASETSVDNYFTRQYIPENNPEFLLPALFKTTLSKPDVDTRADKFIKY
jgi:hypothetical protein